MHRVCLPDCRHHYTNYKRSTVYRSTYNIRVSSPPRMIQVVSAVLARRISTRRSAKMPVTREWRQKFRTDSLRMRLLAIVVSPSRGGGFKSPKHGDLPLSSQRTVSSSKEAKHTTVGILYVITHRTHKLPVDCSVLTILQLEVQSQIQT